MNLPKMTNQQISIPVGEECPYPSQAEAEAFSAKLPRKSSFTRLMILTTKDSRNYFCWCGFNEAGQLQFYYPLFKDDASPPTPPSSGRPIHEGERLKYGNDFYLIAIDETLGVVVRQIAILSTTVDAGNAWHMMTLTPQGAGYDEPDYYLVKVSLVSDPKLICVCWCIMPHTRGKNKLMPVFKEDRAAFNAIPFKDLNWEYLHEGESFRHDDKIYQVCKDEIGDYYIAPSPLQIYRLND